MNKGIVMDITDSNLIVMRPDGKFDRVPRKQRTCEIGEEIVYADSGIQWKRPSVAGRSALAAAVVFCIVLFASFSGKLGTPEVVAYVSMDINPSVEFGIDIKEKVIELHGLNDDGAQLIDAVDYKNKPLEQVTSVLLDKAEQKSLARGEGEIVIASTVVGDNSKVSDIQIAEKLKAQVTKHIERVHPNEAAAYQVAAFAAPQEVREAAQQNGLSMGKYTVYLNAKSTGTPVTVDDLKRESVLQLSKEHPEVAQLMQPDHLPGKTQMKQLVQEEKSGELDKKFEEKQKARKDTSKPPVQNGNGKNDLKAPTSTNGNSTNKTNTSGSNSNNNKNSNNNNSNRNSNNNSSNNNSKNGSSSDKKDDKKDEKNDDKKDNRTGSSVPTTGTPPVTGSSGKPGTTSPSTSHPTDKQDGNNDSKKDDTKKDNLKQNSEDRRSEDSRRSDDVSKDDKKDTSSKDDSKKDDNKTSDNRNEDIKNDNNKNDNNKSDNNKNDNIKNEDKSK